MTYAQKRCYNISRVGYLTHANLTGDGENLFFGGYYPPKQYTCTQAVDDWFVYTIQTKSILK